MTIRVRLTLWYTLVLGGLLIGFAVLAHALLARFSIQRIDRSLEETARAFATALIATAGRGAASSAQPLEVMSRFTSGELEIVVLDQAERIVARTPRVVPGMMERSPRPQLAALLREVAGAQGVLATLPGDDHPRRAFGMAIQVGDRRQLVLVAQDLGERDAMLKEARTAFASTIALAVALILAAGYFLAGRTLAPVATLAAQAQKIEASTLHQRLRARNEEDELGRLARAFNNLLARLDRAFEQQRQFMADASHELRTPIAVVRGEADVALARETRPADDYRESLDVIRDEARRMTRLVDDLLLLARSDAGADALSLTQVDLGELVGEAVRAVRTLAAERAVSVHYEPGDELPMRADDALLRRAVVNLLDNAIKHGGAGGDVVARAFRDTDGSYVISVTDRGPGIAPEIRDRLFERFVRGPQDGDNLTWHRPGAGLGLAIARRIAEAHSGSLELARTGPDGTEFLIRVASAQPTTAAR